MLDLFIKVHDLNFTCKNVKHGRCPLVRCSDMNFFLAGENNSRWQSTCWELDINFQWNDGTTIAALLHYVLPGAWRYPSGNHMEDPALDNNDFHFGITKLLANLMQYSCTSCSVILWKINIWLVPSTLPLSQTDCHQLCLLTGKIHIWAWRQPHHSTSFASLVFTGKIKIGYFLNRSHKSIERDV